MRRRGPTPAGLRGILGVLVGALAGILPPWTAEAHLVTTGLGPLYDGVSHVLMSPEDLVPALAMALLAGLNGPEAGRRALFALTAGWLGGGFGGFLVGASPAWGAVTAGSFLVLGGLTAIDRPLSPGAVTALAAAVGLLHGWLNGSGLAGAEPGIAGLAGIGATVFTAVALASALAVGLRPTGARIAIRVAGSWVAAIGLLMAGWSLRGHV